MTKREYAEVIAKAVNGRVEEISKANGIELTGIMVRREGSNIAPTVYIDGYYEEGVPVEVATEKVKETIDREYVNINQGVDVSFFMDFEKVKPLLRAKLLNGEKNNAEVKRSAKKYGFDDLIIVPYCKVTVNGIEGSITIKKEHIERWGVTARYVIDTAIKNTAQDARIEDMMEMLAEMSGIPVSELPKEYLNAPRMVVVTNDQKMYGAMAVISKMDYLKEMYGSYFVIPSSVHEVIIVPAESENDKDGLEEIIHSVNTEVLNPIDYLSDKAYFVA